METQDTIWILDEKTDEETIPASWLKDEIDPSTCTNAKNIVVEKMAVHPLGLRGSKEQRETFEHKCVEFAKHIEEGTKVYWYDGQYPYAGSVGFILIREKTNKAITILTVASALDRPLKLICQV